MRRRAIVVGALAVLAAVGGPVAPAGAHATLEGTTPQRGAILASAPGQVVFRFSEPITGTAGAVRVYGPRGARVDDGAAFHPGGRANAYAVRLRSGLTAGTYTSTYQVISADGHVVAAGSTFSIGSPSATTGSVVGFLEGQKAGPVTRTALTVARGVQLAAIAAGVGSLLFFLLLWPRALARAGLEDGETRAADAAFERRSRALLLGSAVAGVSSAALAVGLDAASASGDGLVRAVTGGALADTIGSRFGTIWSIAAVAWALLGAGATLLLRARAPGRASRARLVLLLPAAYLLFVPGIGGHAGAVSPEAALIPANLVHVAAAAVWAGGITLLLVALRPATASLEPPERARLLVTVVGDFSAVALGAVLAVALSGVVQAIALLGSLGDLIHTGYGRLLLAKSAILLVLVALGAVQRRRAMPRLHAASADGRPPGEAGRLLRNLLRGEAALLLAVFAVTAVLSGAAPPGPAVPGPLNLQGRIGPAQFDATVDPAQVGPNTIHLYLLDPRTGAPWDHAVEVHADVRQPRLGIGPLTRRGTRSGPGHYTVTGLQLGAPGTWILQLSVRVSEFDEYLATRKVRVR